MCKLKLCMHSQLWGMHSSGFIVLHSCRQPLVPVPCRAGPPVAAAACVCGSPEFLPAVDPLTAPDAAAVFWTAACAPCEMRAVVTAF